MSDPQTGSPPKDLRMAWNEWVALARFLDLPSGADTKDVRERYYLMRGYFHDSLVRVGLRAEDALTEASNAK